MQHGRVCLLTIKTARTETENSTACSFVSEQTPSASCNSCARMQRGSHCLLYLLYLLYCTEPKGGPFLVKAALLMSRHGCIPSIARSSTTRDTIVPSGWWLVVCCSADPLLGFGVHMLAAGRVLPVVRVLAVFRLTQVYILAWVIMVSIYRERECICAIICNHMCNHLQPIYMYRMYICVECIYIHMYRIEQFEKQS
jgi:hypothetical protein